MNRVQDELIHCDIKGKPACDAESRGALTAESSWNCFACCHEAVDIFMRQLQWAELEKIRREDDARLNNEDVPESVYESVKECKRKLQEALKCQLRVIERAQVNCELN